MSEQIVIYFALASALAAIIYGFITSKVILNESAGSSKMQAIADAIKQGASAYLNRQYKTIAFIAIVVALILGFALNWTTAIAFLIGATLSAIAGYIGMNISVRTNVRVAEAARSGIKKAMDLAFKGGSVTGFLVVGLGLLGVTGFYAITKDPKALIGLGFGGSLISIFARLCG